MIDKKWILYCNKKKRNAFVSTKGGNWSISYQDYCEACGKIIYKDHSQAKTFVIIPEVPAIPEVKIEVNKGVKTNL